MSQLSHLVNSTNNSMDALNLTPEEVELDGIEQAQDVLELKEIDAEIHANLHAMDVIMDAVDSALAMVTYNTDMQVITATFSDALIAGGIPAEASKATKLGTESVNAENIGVEVFESAGALIQDIVDWVIKLFKKAKAYVKRIFAKNFGSVKRNLANWRKIKTKAESYIDESRIAEDKSKFDIRKGVEYMVMGVKNGVSPKSPEAWDKIIDAVEVFSRQFISMSDAMADYNVSEASELSEVTATVDTLGGEVRKALFEDTKGEDWGVDGANWSTGYGLLGRRVLLLQARDTNPIAANAAFSTGDKTTLPLIKKFINGTFIGIKPSWNKLKKLDDLTVVLPTLAEIDLLADTHIELATNALAFETSKRIAKLESAFDKAMSNAKKWSKDYDSDNADSKRKAIAAASMMSALLQHDRDATLNLSSDMVSYVSALGKAHGAIVSKVFGRYKAAA